MSRHPEIWAGRKKWVRRRYAAPLQNDMPATASFILSMSLLSFFVMRLEMCSSPTARLFFGGFSTMKSSPRTRRRYYREGWVVLEGALWEKIWRITSIQFTYYGSGPIEPHIGAGRQGARRYRAPAHTILVFQRTGHATGLQTPHLNRSQRRQATPSNASRTRYILTGLTPHSSLDCA